MNNLEQQFKNLKNQFDFEEPSMGHFNRFQEKLKQPAKTKKFNYKKLSIAAAVILFCGIIFGTIISTNSAGKELASISPKMQETQDYFSTVIHEELEKIEKQKTTENTVIITDAFKKLKQIETNYKKLKIDLKQSNNSKQIIFAMINNYQQRITVLQNLLKDLDNFKQLKNIENENTTI